MKIHKIYSSVIVLITLVVFNGFPVEAASLAESRAAYRAAAYKLLYERYKIAITQQYGDAGKVTEQQLQEMTNAVTDCFMESMARYPEKYQIIAYGLTAKGKSYLEANSAMEAALKADMAGDDEAAQALRQKVLENVNYARDCVTKASQLK